MFDFTPTTLSLPAHTLFDLRLVNASVEDTLNAICSAGRTRVAFVNADCVNLAARDEDYRSALETADALLPDGAGISLAARLIGAQFEANLNGTDLFPALCRRAALEGESIFLLGGMPGVAEVAGETAKKLAPGLRIAGSRDGYFTAEDTGRVISEINASGADILLVGLGAPWQDVWLRDHAKALNPSIMMGVGGLFDYYSGRIARAPFAMRRVGLEWVWRLMMEPRRLARRYLLGNPLFIARAARNMLSLRGGDMAKRAVDVIGSALGLIALSPLFLLLVALIRLESDGKAFFTQVRIGRGGKAFKMIKFRSMYEDAEARRAALLKTSDRGGVCFKSKNDPRVTRIGRIIRRASIDELPQLINVLKGDMSLVGPRPALPSEVDNYPPAAHRRHEVKPGITGLWQVSGRADVDFDKMIDLDLAYVNARSFLLDSLLLALTVRAVVGGKGAC